MTLARVFRTFGLDASVVQTDNDLAAVMIGRHDGKIACVNDDAVGPYKSEDEFYDGIESQVRSQI